MALKVMALKKTKADGKSTTTSVLKDMAGEETSTIKEDVIPMPDITGNVANVTYEVGMTLNLGNYESARISVGVTMPCLPDDVDTTFDKIKTWSTEKIISEAKVVKEFVASR